MKDRQAQVAMEFLLFTILGVFFVLILVGLAVHLSSNALDTQGYQEAEDLALSLQEELVLASQMQPGYHRAINLPTQLRRGTYTITTQQESFTIEKDGVTITLQTPPLNGTFAIGANTIRNENQTIIIN